MGKNRGRGGGINPKTFNKIIAQLRAKNNSLAAAITANTPIPLPTKPLCEGVVPTARAFFDSMFDEDEWKGEIVAQIVNETYECRACKEKSIPKALVVNKHDHLTHVVKSSVPGGGSRFCGPVQKEPVQKEVKP